MRIRFVSEGKATTLDVMIMRDIDGWWAYLPDEWYFDDDPGCTQRHEDSKKELLGQLRGGYGVYRTDEEGTG